MYVYINSHEDGWYSTLYIYITESLSYAHGHIIFGIKLRKELKKNRVTPTPTIKNNLKL